MRLTFRPVDSDPLVYTVTQQSFTVGRSPACEVSLVLDGISRRHCHIEYKNSNIYVTDLNSTNGVFIDGKRIRPGIPVRYQTFLSLGIGSIPSVEIELPDTSRFSLASWTAAPEAPAPAAPSSATGHTRTRPLPRPRPTPAVKVEARSESSSWVINLLALMVLAGGMAFFFYTHTKTERPVFKPKANKSKNINDNGHF